MPPRPPMRFHPSIHLLPVLFGTAAVIHAAAQPFPFAEATIEQLQARMAAGTLTSRELTQAYLERIQEIDVRGPALRSVLEINPDARDIATQLDAERAAGKV